MGEDISNRSEIERNQQYLQRKKDIDNNGASNPREIDLDKVSKPDEEKEISMSDLSLSRIHKQNILNSFDKGIYKNNKENDKLGRSGQHYTNKTGGYEVKNSMVDVDDLTDLDIEAKKYNVFYFYKTNRNIVSYLILYDKKEKKQVMLIPGQDYPLDLKTKEVVRTTPLSQMDPKRLQLNKTKINYLIQNKKDGQL